MTPDGERKLTLTDDPGAPEHRLREAIKQTAIVLGQVRIETWGEALEEEPSQEYDPIAVTPTGGKYEGRNCGVLNEGDLVSGHFQGQIMQDGIHLHFLADGEDDEWQLSFTASPARCRELALRLIEIAGDAEGSEAVVTGE